MLADVLMMPGLLLWTPWASKNLPNAVEWLLFVGNSAVWGFLISTIVGLVATRRRPKMARPAKPSEKSSGT